MNTAHTTANHADTEDGFNCEQCFDTETIDRAGAEIPCPYCTAFYHPSSVTVVEREHAGTGQRGYVALDRSQHPEGRTYGAWCRTYDEALRYRNRRRGVIKAALPQAHGAVPAAHGPDDLGLVAAGVVQGFFEAGLRAREVALVAQGVALARQRIGQADGVAGAAAMFVCRPDIWAERMKLIPKAAQPRNTIIAWRPRKCHP